MLRDFSDENKQRLLGLVKEVENDNQPALLDWIGDRWCDFEDMIFQLGIRQNITDLDVYHKRVIDQNNASAKTIENIFNNVKDVDNVFASRFKNYEQLLSTHLYYIVAMRDQISPANGKFSTADIKQNMTSAENAITMATFNFILGGIIDTKVDKPPEEDPPTPPEVVIVAPTGENQIKFSKEVKAGTIRQVVQNAGTEGYDESNWGQYAYCSGSACSVACASMALSWLGIDKTPEQICAINAETNAVLHPESGPDSMCWDTLGYRVQNEGTNLVYENISIPDGTSTDIDNGLRDFREHPDIYSPPIINIENNANNPGGDHYVVVIGRYPNGDYITLCPGSMGETRYSKDTICYQVIRYHK